MEFYNSFFTIYKKIAKTAYYQENRDLTLNKAKNYYNNYIEILRQRARNKYRELSE